MFYRLQHLGKEKECFKNAAAKIFNNKTCEMRFMKNAYSSYWLWGIQKKGAAKIAIMPLGVKYKKSRRLYIRVFYSERADS